MNTAFIQKHWLTLLIVVISAVVLLPVIKGAASLAGLVGKVLSAPAKFAEWIDKNSITVVGLRTAFEDIANRYAYVAGTTRDENFIKNLKALDPKYFSTSWKNATLKRFKETTGKSNVLSQIGNLGGFGTGFGL